MIAARKPVKEITFGWCLSDKHEDCRVRYGDNIVCICDCENHGVNRKQSQEESDRQVKEITERLNGFGKDGARPTRSDFTRDGYNYKAAVVVHRDAETIEELERRRLA